MTAQEFVKLVNVGIGQAALRATLNELIDTGFRDGSREAAMAAWFRSQSQEDKQRVSNAINRGIHQAIFTLFVVLDKMDVIEPGPERGAFELYYVREPEHLLLNDPNREPLHDIYSAVLAGGDEKPD